MQKLGTRTLETERLILRRFSPRDAEDMYRNWASDPEVTRFLTWPCHTSPEGTRALLEQWAEKYADGTYFNWAIEYRRSRQAIGSIAVGKLNEEIGSAELGYCIGREYWGQGIMPEACEELIRHAFEDLNVIKIWCAYYEGNEQSKKVQEKVGFKYQWTTEGLEVKQMNEVRTGVVNCLTREEWERENK